MIDGVTLLRQLLSGISNWACFVFFWGLLCVVRVSKDEAANRKSNPGTNLEGHVSSLIRGLRKAESAHPSSYSPLNASIEHLGSGKFQP